MFVGRKHAMTCAGPVRQLIVARHGRQFYLQFLPLDIEVVPLLIDIMQLDNLHPVLMSHPDYSDC